MSVASWVNTLTLNLTTIRERFSQGECTRFLRMRRKRCAVSVNIVEVGLEFWFEYYDFRVL